MRVVTAPPRKFPQKTLRAMRAANFEIGDQYRAHARGIGFGLAFDQGFGQQDRRSAWRRRGLRR